MFDPLSLHQWFPTFLASWTIGVARGGQRSHVPPKGLENMVILCFERRFFKQNRVIHLKSNILAPQFFWPLPNFWAGYATVMDPFDDLAESCSVTYTWSLLQKAVIRIARQKSLMFHGTYRVTN